MPVDVVARAESLPFDTDSFDFVLASHVLEHIPDPIQALSEWARVARRYMYIVLPKRDNRFDRARPLTSLEDLRTRHANAFFSDEDKHYSVWTSHTFAELCSYLGFHVVEICDPDDKRGNGFALLLEVPCSSACTDVT